MGVGGFLSGCRFFGTVAIVVSVSNSKIRLTWISHLIRPLLGLTLRNLTTVVVTLLPRHCEVEPPFRADDVVGIIGSGDIDQASKSAR
jgi:hypothetical protein